jgi:hypothetical protein
MAFDVADRKTLSMAVPPEGLKKEKHYPWQPSGLT